MTNSAVCVLRTSASRRSCPRAAAKPKKGRGRTWLSALLIIVACLLAPLSVVSVWASGEVSDTERYVSTVAPLASDPAIQDAVSARVTDEIFKYVDLEGLTQEAVDTISANRDLTPRQVAALDALSGPLTSGIESFTGDKVQEIVDPRPSPPHGRRRTRWHMISSLRRCPARTPVPSRSRTTR